MAAASGHKNLQGRASANARDIAAMPPPPLPLKPLNRQSSKFLGSSSYPDPQSSSNRPPELDGSHTDFAEVKGFGAVNYRLPDSEHPILSDEEMAAMSARSDEAMTEMKWMCKPFFDPNFIIREPPSMELSAELINDLGFGFMLANKEGEKAQGKANGNVRPNPAQIMQARNVAPLKTPMVPQDQVTKRKEYGEDNEKIPHVRLDVGRQAHHPTKKVKSVHGDDSQTHIGVFYHDASNESQQQQDYTSPYGESQFRDSHADAFDEPLVHGDRSSRRTSVQDVHSNSGGGTSKEQNWGMVGQHPNQAVKPCHPQDHFSKSFRTNIHEHQPPRRLSGASPYLRASTVRDQITNQQCSALEPRGSVNRYFDGHVQAGQTLRHRSPTSSYTPNTQPPTQPAARHPGSRADRGHHRGSLTRMESNHRYHPYANLKKSNAQSVAAPPTQQLNDGNQLHPEWAPSAAINNEHILDMTPASLEHPPPLYGPPNLDHIFEYIGDDPGKGIDIERTRKAREYILRGLGRNS